MTSNIIQKKIYKELYKSGNFKVWSHDEDEISYKKIFDIIELNGIKKHHALDIGCGTGKYTNLLTEVGFKSVLGIDFVEEVLMDNAKFEKENLHFVCTDLFVLSLNEKFKKFGFFFDRGVFAHLEKEKYKEYFDKINSVGTFNYKVLLTCFSEEYHLTASQKNLKAFYHNGLRFQKFTKDDLISIFSTRYRILYLDKVYKSNNRVFWHLLIEKK